MRHFKAVFLESGNNFKSRRVVAMVVGRYLGSIDPWNETLLGCEVSIPLMCGGVGRGVVVVEE